MEHRTETKKVNNLRLTPKLGYNSLKDVTHTKKEVREPLVLYKDTKDTCKLVF